MAGVPKSDRRCDCGECRAGDRLPARLKGWPDSFQLRLFAPKAEPAYDHVWFWRAKLAERKGQRCAVIARGTKGSVLVAFADGFTVITGRHAVRRTAITKVPS